jgi:hypothetical protein
VSADVARWDGDVPLDENDQPLVDWFVDRDGMRLLVYKMGAGVEWATDRITKSGTLFIVGGNEPTAAEAWQAVHDAATEYRDMLAEHGLLETA